MSCEHDLTWSKAAALKNICSYSFRIFILWYKAEKFMNIYHISLLSWKIFVLMKLVYVICGSFLWLFTLLCNFLLPLILFGCTSCTTTTSTYETSGLSLSATQNSLLHNSCTLYVLCLHSWKYCMCSSNPHTDVTRQKTDFYLQLLVHKVNFYLKKSLMFLSSNSIRLLWVWVWTQ